MVKLGAATRPIWEIEKKILTVTFADIRAVYTRVNKPRLTLAAAYLSRERNYLYEYKLPGQDKPRLEKAVNVDFVPFIRGVRGLRKPRLIFSRINGPIMPDTLNSTRSRNNLYP